MFVYELTEIGVVEKTQNFNQIYNIFRYVLLLSIICTKIQKHNLCVIKYVMLIMYYLGCKISRFICNVYYVIIKPYVL